MENESPWTSERELAGQIIYLHDDTKLGFRKIAKELTSQGFEMSKDKAHRLYHKYKTHDKVEVEEDDELRGLRETEKEAQKSLRLLREKEETQRCIATLAVEKADASFKYRRALFESKMALLDFAEKVLPARTPAIWVQITDFCELEKIDLADALKEALGDQAHFEEIRADYKKQNGNYLLDQHLCFQIEEWLPQTKIEELEEEAEDLKDYEPNMIIEDDEFAYIQIRLDDQE